MIYTYFFIYNYIFYKSATIDFLYFYSTYSTYFSIHKKKEPIPFLFIYYL